MPPKADTMQFSAFYCERLAAAHMAYRRATADVEGVKPDWSTAKNTREDRFEALDNAMGEIREAEGERVRAADKRLSQPWTADECDRLGKLHADYHRADKKFKELDAQKKRYEKLRDDLKADMVKLVGEAMSGEGLFEGGDKDEPWKGIHLSDVMGEPNAQPYAKQGLHTLGDVLEAWNNKALAAFVKSGDLSQTHVDFLVETIHSWAEERGIPSETFPDRPKPSKPTAKKKGSSPKKKATAKKEPKKEKELVDAKGVAVPTFVGGPLPSTDEHDNWADESFYSHVDESAIVFSLDEKKRERTFEAIGAQLTSLIDAKVYTPAQFIAWLRELATGTKADVAQLDTLYDGSLGLDEWAVTGLLHFCAEQTNNTGHVGMYLAFDQMMGALPAGVWARLVERVPLIEELVERGPEDRYAKVSAVRTDRAFAEEGAKKPRKKRTSKKKATTRKKATGKKKKSSKKKRGK